MKTFTQISYNLLLIATTLLLSALLAISCGSVERTLKRAEAATSLGEYCEASNLYKKAYQRTPPRAREQRGKIAYSLGESYRKYGNAVKALAAYRNAERYKNTDTLTFYYEGEMFRTMGDYRSAEKSYRMRLDSVPDDSLAIKALYMAQSAPTIKGKGSAYSIRQEKTFNSSRADYSPAYLGKEASQLYFTTTRSQATGNDLSGITGMKNGDIFFSKKDEKGRWTIPEIAEGINTEYDEGACTFSQDGQTMYLTVCRTDPQYPRMAEIWTSTRSDAKWSKPTQLKLSADTLSSYAHPAPSPDGRWIYFVSDMPGGFGGLDIWRAPFESKHGVGPVENLGKDVNTEADEMFPAFRPSGELYFSSRGHIPNLGGLDLYAATEDTATNSWKVKALPYPMNSNGDDFGITFEGLHNRGYFSSNRSTGGKGWDKIYAFSFPEVLQTVKGWVYEQDAYELPQATVYMVGNDGTNLKFGVQSDGSFEQPVTPGVDYVFLATCPGYLNYKNQLHADSLETEHQHVLQFPLPSISVPVLVRNVFYEFDKADLTENSREALDRLTNLLKENPNITIELSAHCDYKGNDAYNEKLSQRRAESVVKYLTEHGIKAERLTAKGYGEKVPKIVNKKLTETYSFLHENDTLTTNYILNLPPEQQEICNALNRRTEFRVLRTTYGLLDENGNLRPDALKPKEKE